MIVGIGGKLSAGKTALAVYLAHEEFKKGSRVISNIKLQFPHDYISHENLAQWLIDNRTDERKVRRAFQNSILLIDEAGQLFDARKATSYLAEVMTSFIMFLGKLDCHCIMTYQILESQIDVRMREICDIFIRCYRLDKNKQPFFFGPRIVKEKTYTQVVMEIDLGPQGVKIMQFVMDLSAAYPLYNTREINMLDRQQFLKN